MLPQTIIDRARRLSSTKSNYYVDADAIADLNQVKNNLWSTIVTYVDEDYYWTEWPFNLVVGQGAYALPAIAANTAGTKKLKDVKIAYNSTPYPGTTSLQYLVAKEISPSNLAYPWSYYEQFQNPLFPIYHVSNNSIYIAPLPTAAVTNGLSFSGIRSIPDYNLSTTAEADMIIPLDQQELMVYGLFEYIFNQKTMKAEAIDARQEYETMKNNMINNLSDRVIAPFENQFPDDFAQEQVGYPIPQG